MAGHLHCLQEAGLRAVDHSPLQILAGRIRDRVDSEIEPSPVGLDALEHCLHLAGFGHVERQEQLGAELIGERRDVLLGLVVEVGQRDVRAEGAQLGRAAVCDAVGIGDSDHEPALSLQHFADARARVPDDWQRIDRVVRSGKDGRIGHYVISSS